MARQRYVLILAGDIHEGNQYAKRVGLPRFAYRAVSSAGSIKGIRSADVHILPSFHGRRDRFAILSQFRWAPDIRKFDVEMPEAPEEPAIDQGDGMGQQLTIDDAIESAAVDEDGPLTVLGKDGSGRFAAPIEPNPAVEAVEKQDAFAKVVELFETPQEVLQEYVPPFPIEEPTPEPFDRVALMQDMSDELEDEDAPTGETEQSEDPASTPEVKRRRKRCKVEGCGELVWDRAEHEAAEHAEAS